MTTRKKNRLQEVNTLVSQGVRSTVIAEQKADEWGVSERQAWKYISEAKELSGEKDDKKELNELSQAFERFKEGDDKFSVWEKTDFDTGAVYEIPEDERKKWNSFIRYGWGQPERIESVIQEDKTGLSKLDAYCEGVRSGEIEVCEQVRQAVDRHYKNLERQFEDDFPYYFEPLAALHYIRFFEYKLPHHTGIMAGEPIVFEPWQWFNYGSVFGWLKKDRFRGYPLRRFRTATLIYPKKNGKSTVSGGTGIYMSEFDGWPGAQCFIIATSQSHAMELGYRDATIMINENDWLNERYDVKKGGATIGIYCDRNNSYYKPITSKEDSEDGKNVHFCGPDETKDLEDAGIYDLMEEGMVSAPNGLMMNTSTEGFNDNSLLAEQREYLENVLDPNSEIKDDTLFGVVYTIDKEDKEDEDGNERDRWWMDLDLYKKANPNWGISVFEDTIKAKFQKAINSPKKRNSLKTKHLNVRTTSQDAFIEKNKWDACGYSEIESPMNSLVDLLKKYRGNRAIGGLDLGSVSDFTSFVLIIEVDEPWRWDALPMFWIPKDTLKERKNSETITPWIREGYITTTPGDYTNHDFVEDTIKEMYRFIDIRDLAYDPSGMQQMATHLEQEGMELSYISQNYYRMEPCIAALEQLIISKQINHGMNPVLRWMFGNVAIAQNSKEQRMFDKKSAPDKIDGMQALAMAVGQAMKMEEEFGSIYDTRGIEVITEGEAPIIEETDRKGEQVLPNMADGDYS